MGDSLEGGDASSDTQNVGVIDYATFVNYLRKATTVHLPEDDGSKSPALQAALEEKNSQECIRKFISDSQVSTLYVQRSSSKDDDTDQPPEGEEEKEPVSYYVSNEVYYTNSKISSLAFIKRGPVVEADKSIWSQVRVISLNDGSPYETLHAYVSKSVAPYFKSYVKESGRADSNTKTVQEIRRSANFDRDEDRLLIKIISSYKDVIDCSKKGLGWGSKEKSWCEITLRFNDSNKDRPLRTKKCLKDRYKNLKKRTRDKQLKQCRQLTDVEEAMIELLTGQTDPLQDDVEKETTLEPDNRFLIEEVIIKEEALEDIPDIVSVTGDIFERCLNQHIVSSENVVPSSVVGRDDTNSSGNNNKRSSRKSRNNRLTLKRLNYRLMRDKLEFVKLQRAKFLEEQTLKTELLKRKIEVQKRKLELLKQQGVPKKKSGPKTKNKVQSNKK